MKLKEDIIENDIEKKFNNLLNNNIINQNIIKNNLKRDILDYETFVKSHIKKFSEVNNKILERIQNNINKINSNYKAKLYGSRATNLCLMWSDIDIVIYHEKKNRKRIENEISKDIEDLEEMDNVIEEKLDLLDKLNKILNNDISFVENIKYLNKARVPIIKIKTTKEFNNTMIDITLQTKEHYGLRCVKLIKKFLKEYESLEPLLFCLKTILKISELNDPYNGGLSSYALILMVVNFLQIQKKMNKNINKDKIGDLFYDLLFYYGGRKDSNFIDLNNIKKYSEFSNKNNNCLVYISDPLDKNNNVSKSSFKFIEVKFIFLMSLQILNEPCFCQCHYLKKLDFNLNTCNSEHNFLNKIFFGLKRGKINSCLLDNN